jgi:outer membrane murein-binding lipoprotein Lpp
MMKFNKLALIAVASFCLLQAGCTDKKKIAELENANQSLRAENQALHSHLEEASKLQAQAQQESEQTKAQLVAQRNEVSRLQARNQEAEAKLAALTPQAATTMITVKTPVTHEEFKAKVTGLTAEQLSNYAGKPLGSSSNGPREYWDYDGITYDSVTGKADRKVQVLLTNGRVAGVIFIP